MMMVKAPAPRDLTGETIDSGGPSVKNTRREDEVTRLMLDLTPLPCSLWDNKGRLIAVNGHTIGLFGFTSRSDKPLFDILPELSPEYQDDGTATAEKIKMTIDAVLKTGYERAEFLFKTASGDPLPLEISLIRIPWKSSYCVVAYLKDLRSQKAAEEKARKADLRSRELEIQTLAAKAASEAKSSFLAAMSHEIRTPLNGIIGLSKIELQKELPEDTRMNLERIYNSGSNLLGIINDIPDISKIETGNLELIPEHYDVPELINDVVQRNIIRLGSKPLQFKLFINETIPVRLRGDELRIKQIVNNLLSNAFTYTNRSTVTLEVDWEKVEQDIWLILKAGDITVGSEYEKGSVFTARIRQEIVDSTPIGKETAENLQFRRFVKKSMHPEQNLIRSSMPYGRVLVVDDVETNLFVAKGLMRPYGLAIDCASNGREAVEKIRAMENEPAAKKYDVIFMDHMMPEMDGIEAVRIIRNEIGSEYARNVPIIALTANALKGNEEMFLSRGFTAYIAKPIDIFQLDAALNTWIRDKQRPRLSVQR
jgi:CheY-like chemotaxis protein/nitrogen-specific signal transduction histidine kinase